MSRIYPAGDGITNGFTASGPAYAENVFHVTEANWQVDFLYWFSNTASSQEPLDLILRNYDTGATLATATVGAVTQLGKWIPCTISPVVLEVGTAYSVAADWATGFVGGFANPHPSPQAPLAWDTQHYGDGTLATPTTNTYYNPSAAGLDVHLTTSPDYTAPSAVASVDAAFDAYLSSDSTTNTHHADLPWLTEADVTTILARLGLVDTAEASGRGIAATVGALLTWLAQNGSSLLTGLNALRGDHDIGTSPVTLNDLLAARDTILNQMRSYQDQLLATSAPLGNALANFPGVGWAMTDETDFGSAIHYLQSADLYVCTCTTPPPNLGATLADDVNVYYRLGWWSPMNGSGVRDRRFIDFDAAHLVDAGRRIESCVVQYQPGATGHIQAWTYTP